MTRSDTSLHVVTRRPGYLPAAKRTYRTQLLPARHRLPPPPTTRLSAAERCDSILDGRAQARGGAQDRRHELPAERAQEGG